MRISELSTLSFQQAEIEMRALIRSGRASGTEQEEKRNMEFVIAVSAIVILDYNTEF